MTTISEAITNIKKAENDADKLIEDAKVKSSETVESGGTFKEDNIALNEVGKNSKKAVEIATQGNWK
mgnify:CR=1 FL=1